MKTEDFDDAIRRKLESLQNEHTQQDVDAVHRHVRHQKQGASKRRRAVIFLFATAAVLFGGLLTWNIMQVSEINSLKKNIAQLKANSIQAKADSQKSAPVSASVMALETNNSSYKTHEAKSAPVLKNNSVEFGRPQVDEKHSFTKETKSAPAFYQNSVRAEKTDKPEQPTPPANPTGKPAVENLTIYKDHSVPEEQDHTFETPAITGTMQSKSVSENLIPIPEKEQIISSASNDEATGTLSSGDSSSATKPVVAVNPLRDSAAVNINHDQPVYIKNWHYRLGIGVDAGNRQLGVSLLGEAVFKNHWAVSTGIKLLKNGEELFDDDDDYDDHKQKGFKKTYEKQVDTGGHRNIEIRNTIFQIPLCLSYNFPLKHNFALQVGLGTDLDMYVKQHVNYKRVNSANDLQTSQFVTKYPSVYFNNCVISTGLQKTIHRFVFQLSPYISPQLKRVDYKTQDLYYGLRFRTYFEF